MRSFCQLYEALDGTTRTNAKVEAMVRYFEAAPAEDAAWAVFFLTGQRLKRLISGRTLRAWAQQRTGLPEWLVDEAHAAVGDSAETAALLLDRPPSPAPRPCRCTAGSRSGILPLARPAGRPPVCRGLRLVAGAAARRAVRPEQAPDRRLSGRRLEAPGRARARRGRKAAARDDRPSPDGPAAAERRLVSRPARRRERRRPGRGPTRSSSPRRSRPTRKPWVRSRTGWPNGSGMAFAASSCAAAARFFCGRAARS